MPCPVNEMKDNADILQRHSIRLKGYDYSQNGAYFVTVCTFEKKCLLGNVINGQILLNEFGIIVKHEWLKTGELHENVVLDEYIVMPNHFHCIILIEGTARRAPTIERYGHPTVNSLPTIIRSFKSAVTKQIHQILQTSIQPVWQRNYYEHTIRDENDLNMIREYIINNQLKWEFDSENPINIPSL